MNLKEQLEALAYDIAFWLAAFANPDYPAEQLGALTIEVCPKLRAAAIIVLLTKADSDAFFHNLIRSAKCRVVYLQRLAKAGIVQDHHQASGRVEPFLDAVAADDFVSARQIVALSLTDWMQGHEYEDDFCYAQILHGLITIPRDEPRLQTLFERFENALSGQPDARLGMTKVLAGGKKNDFDEAFEGLLAQRALHIEVEKARHKMEDPQVIAERQVYVEGLAILRIADRLGFVTQSEYRFCPSIARVPMGKPFPGE